MPNLALAIRCLLLHNHEPRRPKTHHGISPAPAQVAPGFDSQGFEDGPAVGTKRGEAARTEPPEGRSPAAEPPRDEGPGGVCTEVKEAGERRGKLSGVPCVPSSGHDVINKGTPALPERDFPDRFTEGKGPRIRRGCEGGIGAMGTTRRSRQVRLSFLRLYVRVSLARFTTTGGRS